MNTWIVGKGLMKPHFQIKKLFTLNYIQTMKITDEDYIRAQKVFESFKLKKLGGYHDLYVQSDTLLLADLFEIFRNKCIVMYELDSAHFFICTQISMAKVKLELLTNNDMLMLVEKRIRGGICNVIPRYAMASNKYMKNYNKNIESQQLMYLDANNLHGWAIFQKLPVNCFKWKKRYLNLMSSS